MARLSKENLDFILKNKIPLEEVFDATGLRRKDYLLIMEQNGYRFAYGVTPCEKFGHTLRAKNGDCVICRPMTVSYTKRYREKGYVYIVVSMKHKLFKIGSSKDYEFRENNLNYEKYAGIDDWRLLAYSLQNERALVENKIQSCLRDFQVQRSYFKGEQPVIATEIFNIDITHLLKIIKSLGYVFEFPNQGLLSELYDKQKLQLTDEQQKKRLVAQEIAKLVSTDKKQRQHLRELLEKIKSENTPNYSMQHQNFILCSPRILNEYLIDNDFWRTFIARLTQLIKPIKEIPAIKAYQHNQDTDWLLNSEFAVMHEQEEWGRIKKHLPLSWQIDALQQIADIYQQDKNTHLEFFGAVFPYFAKCIEQNTTPKCVFLLSEDFPKFSSLLISLRQDYFDELGENFVLNILNQLSEQLNVSLRLRKQRQYGHLIYQKRGYGHFADVTPKGSWQGSIQEFSAYMVADCIKDEWQINKQFIDWTAF